MKFSKWLRAAGWAAVLLFLSFTAHGAPPVISVQPADQLVNQGTHVQLSVQVAGGGIGLNYQWWRNGHAIPGAIAFTLDFPSVQPEDAGEYLVIISNPSGAVISRTATLSVIGLKKALADTGVLVGTDAVLEVEPDTPVQMDFQWFRNGAEIPGATNSSLRIPSVQLSDTADYAVRITDVAGTVTNGPIRLTVYLPTEIAQQPRPISIPRGGTGSLKVQAGGTAPWSYQWLKDGTVIPGATNAEFVISNAAYVQSGNYQVIVSNPGGTLTSAVAAVAVGGPMFTTAPAGTVVREGTSIALNVAVEGEGTFTYQWLKNGAPIPGQTSASLSLSNVQLTDDADYSVVVTNFRGSGTSPSAHLTVLGPPRIVSDLAATEINLGSAGALRVQFLGSEPLKYQWFKEGVAIPGATNAALTFASAELNDAGNYSVRISNPLGSVTSATAPLRIVAVPRITSPPNNLTIREGIPFSLNVTAFSDGAMTWQWFKDGEPISGATSSSLSFSPGRASDSGSYTVQVSNLSGSVMSRPAIVSILVPPTFAQAPAGQTVYEGGTLQLSVVAAGSAPISYQWFKDGVPLPAGTDSVLTVAHVGPEDAGQYSVRLVNSAGAITSGSVPVTIFTKPIITTPPVDKTVNLGASVFFTVQASGSGTLSFQWFHNGAPVKGATIPALIIPSVAQSDLGAYTVRVSNQAGSTESAPVTLSPNSAPVILGQPQSTNVLAGLRFALSVYAPGAAPLSWQWFKNGVPISGATSATLDVDAAQLADSGTYTVEIANAFGTTRSAPCTVNVLFPVHFITQPQPANILEGGSLSLSVQAGGSGPISYQWLKNGIGIAGATNATLNIPNAGISDSGTYSVSISNPVGFLLSDSVQVSVQPGNSEQGAGRLIIGGTPFEGFQVSALGVPGQTYDVQVSSNIGGPWVTLQTVTVDSSGRFAITPPPLSINRTWFVRTVRH